MNIGFEENTAVEEFIIDIRDKNDVIKHRYALNSKDIEKNALMSEHYIQLEEFSLDSLVKFVRTDYIIWEGEKYMIKEDYIPDQVNKFNYKYTLRFDHWTTFLQDDTFYYTNQNLEEADWSLMSNAATHFQLIADNANRYFGVNTFNVGTIGFAEMKLLQFSKVSIWDAATQIADAYKGEWYLTGTTFHLVKKFSYGSEVDFESEISVEKMDRSEGENSEKFTRILAFGSTRNIPANYRETTPGEAVDAIYQKRLRIPASKGKFIDAKPNMSPEEIKSAVVIFEEIYPKRIGTMSSITTVEYTDTNSDTGVVTKWNAYRYKDTGLQFKKAYELPGIELRVVFQSGNLNGTDYAVKFNPDGKPETDPLSQVFEIVRNEDYGKSLPNDILKPQNGDTYILYGFNIQLVSDQYIPAGEQELFDKATEWLADNNKDKSVFDCPTMIEYFEANEMDLEIGQKVRLIHSQFEGGFRSSRIQGYEKHLLDKYQATYTVGDNATYSWPKDIEESIKELQIAGITYQATGRNGVYLIKQFDNTPASDFNAYSAKASDARFFNKQTGGTVRGDTTFQKKIKAKEVISDQFGNETFTSGQFGNGFRTWLAANGQSYAEFDNLMVRREMIINTLTIAEIKSVGGQILLSLANMYCNGVTDGGTYWKCTFDTANGTITNQFAIDDQVICRKFNGANVKYYWARVTSIGTDFINISKSDRDGSGVPAIGDEIIQFGNRTNTSRQSAIMLSAYGSDAPSIKQYTGINSYNLTGKEVTVISPSGNKFTGDFTIQSSGTNVSTAIDNAKNTAISTAATDATNKVNAIQIGGSNMLLNTKNFINTNSWLSANNTVLTYSVSGVNMRLVKVRDVSYVHAYKPLTSTLKQSKEYTLTLRAKCNLALSIQMNTYNINALSTRTSIGVLDFAVADTFYDFKLTFKETTTDANAIMLVSSSAMSLNNVIEYEFIKLEEGNKSSAWSPATEDIQASIDSAQASANAGLLTKVAYTEYNTQIQAINTDISLRAKQSDFNILGNRVTQAEGNISVQAGQISSVVTQVNTAQSTADSKTTIYYQDLQPSNPKVGDIWQMQTYTNINGIVETDTSKNVCRIEKRWNGATWVQINVNVSGSYVTQTNDSITSLVTKTGINGLGVGETLKSLIDQTPSQIQLAVSAIKIGGRNLLLNSDFKNAFTYWGSNGGTRSIIDDVKFIKAAKIVATAYNQGIYTAPVTRTAGNTYVISAYIKADSAMNIVLGHEGGTGGKNFNITTEWQRYETQGIWTSPGSVTFYAGGAGTFYLANIQYEEGNKVTSWNRAQEDVKSEIDAANTAASNAATAASNAQRDANTANNLLTDIANDNKLDPSEKQNTKKEWDIIVSEYSKNISQANSFSVSTTAYTTAYNALNSYITPLLTNLTATSDIVGTTFRSTFKAYYDARTDLLNAVSTKAKAIADSKTTMDEVASSLTIEKNVIKLSSKNIILDGTTMAEAIQANELNVGNGNFKVGTDGKISAKGAELDGRLRLLWNGSSSSEADTLSVVDQSQTPEKTKVLITPMNITSISDIAGNQVDYPLVSGGAAASDSTTNGQKTWTSQTFTLASGKRYDIVIPALVIIGETSTTEDRTTTYSNYRLYLDNTTTGSSQTVASGSTNKTIENAQWNSSYVATGRQAGTYRLRIVIDAKTDAFGNSAASYSIPANAIFTVRPINDAIEIGGNGMMGAFTNTRYFHITTDGFYVRMGSYGFRITEANGIQKSANMGVPSPTWTNI